VSPIREEMTPREERKRRMAKRYSGSLGQKDKVILGAAGGAG
jgi:hypothetical protein